MKKGIILAGGSGTRLDPLTRVICKQLLPVYDKPMIYYPLSVLMLGDIREILIISTPKDLPAFRNLFDDGSQLGIRIEYAEQDEPRGLAEALIIGEEFLSARSCCLILGDNLFHGKLDFFRSALRNNKGATIFAKAVRDPERFGVVELDAEGNVLSIEEKPSSPKSPYAVPGLYIFDESAPTRARSQSPSDRGELEIADLIKSYFHDGILEAKTLGRGVAWLDTGTPDSLLEATNYIGTVQKQNAFQIACIEQIAFERGFIDRDALFLLANMQATVEQSEYLKSCAG
ncbi:MAG: glucose-1-phosphate thymidylyltransferase RfbA [Verrucomicrobiales bacterium]